MPTMSTADGFELRVRADDPVSAPRARVVFVHDIAAWIGAGT